MASSPPPPLPDKYLAEPDLYFTEWIPRELAGNPELARSVGDAREVAQIRLTGERGGVWHFVLGDGTVAVERGSHERPSFTLTLAVETWRRMRKGEQNGLIAFLTGRVKLQGSLRALIRVARLFG
jgi:putative sterol carrier protein